MTNTKRICQPKLSPQDHQEIEMPVIDSSSFNTGPALILELPNLTRMVVITGHHQRSNKIIFFLKLEQVLIMYMYNGDKRTN